MLVIEAGKTIIFDLEQMIDAADACRHQHCGAKDESAVVVGATGTAAFASNTDEAMLSVATIRPQPLRPELLVRKARPDAVRVGVVGVGYLGGFHAQKYARLPEAQLVAVADRMRRVQNGCRSPSIPNSTIELSGAYRPG